ncbi:hypothetical protein WDU99_01595 [Microbacterium sp. Mu-80]|uniref:XRE family transcriptional regulator n=1 Tax=Microbacterium bandirmense TaxID=3122050 RepID=A0ABU8L6P7_9MICO
MTTNDAERWGLWLSQQLKQRDWRQADLVRESQGLIKRDRVSKWVNGIERPTYRLTVVVANSLSLPPEEVLEAAGYSTPTDETDDDSDESALYARHLAAQDTATTLPIDELSLRNIPSQALLSELARRLAERESSGQEQSA